MKYSAKNDLKANLNTVFGSVTRKNLIGYIFIFVFFIFNLYRAAALSITHDEALSYNRFISQDWKTILFSFHSNNHILNSLLAKFTTILLGNSPFVLRLPAVISSGFFFLLLEKIISRHVKNRVTYLLTLLLIICNPFLLDYTTAARGYSLALMFSASAFLLSSSLLQSQGKALSKGQILVLSGLISTVCALSVAANASFAFLNISILGVFWGIQILRIIKRESQKSKLTLIEMTLALILPGFAVFLILNPAIMNYNQSTLYFGSESWFFTVESMVKASFKSSRFSQAANITEQLILRASGLLILALAGTGLVGFYVHARKLLALRSEKTGEDRGLFYVYLVCTITSVILIHTLAYFTLDFFLPNERTGIFLLYLFGILLGCSIDYLDQSGWTKIFQRTGLILMVIMIVLSFSSLRFNYFQRVRYDAGSELIYQTLNDLDTAVLENGIGINWLFEPSLNYYRNQDPASKLPELTREKPNQNQRAFALLPERKTDRNFIQENQLILIYRNELSGAAVYIKP